MITRAIRRGRIFSVTPSHRRAPPPVLMHNQHGPRGAFKLNHGQLRRGPIKHERRVLEDLRDCDEGVRGAGDGGYKIGARHPRERVTVYLPPLHVHYYHYTVRSSSRRPTPVAFRLPRNGAATRKNFARERLAVYSQSTTTLFTTPHYDA